MIFHWQDFLLLITGIDNSYKKSHRSYWTDGISSGLRVSVQVFKVSCTKNYLVCIVINSISHTVSFHRQTSIPAIPNPPGPECVEIIAPASIQILFSNPFSSAISLIRCLIVSLNPMEYIK